MAKHIGMISGFGPAVTMVCYPTFVRLHAEVEVPLALTIAHADLPGLIANLEAGRAEGQAAVFVRHVGALKMGGCDLVAVTSMGGHFCRREFNRLSVLPVLDAVAAPGAHLSMTGVARVGVLGTATVIASHLYGLPGVEVTALEGAKPRGSMPTIKR